MNISSERSLNGMQYSLLSQFIPIIVFSVRYQNTSKCGYAFSLLLHTLNKTQCELMYSRAKQNGSYLGTWVISYLCFNICVALPNNKSTQQKSNCLGLLQAIFAAEATNAQIYFCDSIKAGSSRNIRITTTVSIQPVVSKYCS